jgi:hypothetical protein
VKLRNSNEPPQAEDLGRLSPILMRLSKLARFEEVSDTRCRRHNFKKSDRYRLQSFMRVYPLFYIVLVPVQGPLKLIDSELDD